MTPDEYIRTLTINGKDIKLGFDDYGQCFFVEWEEDGKVNSHSFGVFNSDYMYDLFYMFEPEYARIQDKLSQGRKLSEEESKACDGFENRIDKEYKESMI